MTIPVSNYLFNRYTKSNVYLDMIDFAKSPPLLPNHNVDGDTGKYVIDPVTGENRVIPSFERINESAIKDAIDAEKSRPKKRTAAQVEAGAPPVLSTGKADVNVNYTPSQQNAVIRKQALRGQALNLESGSNSNPTKSRGQALKQASDEFRNSDTRNIIKDVRLVDSHLNGETVDPRLVAEAKERLRTVPDEKLSQIYDAHSGIQEVADDAKNATVKISGAKQNVEKQIKETGVIPSYVNEEDLAKKGTALGINYRPGTKRQSTGYDTPATAPTRRASLIKKTVDKVKSEPVLSPRQVAEAAVNNALKEPVSTPSVDTNVADNLLQIGRQTGAKVQAVGGSLLNKANAAKQRVGEAWQAANESVPEQQYPSSPIGLGTQIKDQQAGVSAKPKGNNRRIAVDLNTPEGKRYTAGINIPDGLFPQQAPIVPPKVESSVAPQVVNKTDGFLSGLSTRQRALGKVGLGVAGAGGVLLGGSILANNLLQDNKAKELERQKALYSPVANPYSPYSSVV